MSAFFTTVVSAFSSAFYATIYATGLFANLATLFVSKCTAIYFTELQTNISAF